MLFMIHLNPGEKTNSWLLVRTLGLKVATEAREEEEEDEEVRGGGLAN